MAEDAKKSTQKSKEIKCKVCKKNASTYKRINDEDICQSCYDRCKTITIIEKANESVIINPNSTLGEISFEKYQEWFETKMSQVKVEIRSEVSQIKEELIQKNTELKKEVDKQRKDLDKANKDITVLRSRVQLLEEKVEDVEKKNSNTSTISNNNLKYIINMDRERRSNNIMLFGLKEKETLKINDVELKGDKEKVNGILNFMGANEQTLKKYMRVGALNESGKDRRP